MSDSRYKFQITIAKFFSFSDWRTQSHILAANVPSHTKYAYDVCNKNWKINNLQEKNRTLSLVEYFFGPEIASTWKNRKAFVILL